MEEIIFFDSTDEDIEFFQNNCKGKYFVTFEKKSLNLLTTFSKEMKRAKVISCFTTSELSEKNLCHFENLKMIALRSVGFNNVDLEYCKKNNIKVLNAKGYGNRTVAEFALGLILSVSRQISKSYMDLIKNENNRDYMGFELIGKTIGIIGVGAIGSELVKIAHNLQMNVLGFDINKNEKLENEYDLKYVDLEYLLSNSDFISVHSPLTKDTYHLINEKNISLLKKNAIIVNTARGELIDTIALYKALALEKIKGAGLDVLEYEENTNNLDFSLDMDYLDKAAIKQILLNHEITKLDNVIVTPHIAYDTKEAKERIRKITIDNIDSYFLGCIKNSVY